MSLNICHVLDTNQLKPIILFHGLLTKQCILCIFASLASISHSIKIGFHLNGYLKIKILLQVDLLLKHVNS